MYNLARWLHLVFGSVFAVVLGVYGWSAMRMAHPSWLRANAAATERKMRLPPTLSVREAAQALRSKEALDGDLVGVRGSAFRISGLTQTTAVLYDARTGEARLTTTPQNLLVRMHTISGFWHDFALGNLFAAVALVTSMGLAVLAVTGIVLWFRVHAERRLGIVLLTVSLLWGFGLLIAMRLT